MRRETSQPLVLCLIFAFSLAVGCGKKKDDKCKVSNSSGFSLVKVKKPITVTEDETNKTCELKVGDTLHKFINASSSFSDGKTIHHFNFTVVPENCGFTKNEHGYSIVNVVSEDADAAFDYGPEFEQEACLKEQAIQPQKIW